MTNFFYPPFNSHTPKGGDTHSLSKILVTIVKLCFEKRDIKLLSENILLLTKRRSQIKQAITKMIQECCSYVDAITDKETKLAFIETLRTVTAGKVSLVELVFISDSLVYACDTNRVQSISHFDFKIYYS